MLEGYEFKNLELLLQSIVHKSYSEKLCNSGIALENSPSVKSTITHTKQSGKDEILQYHL
jgi:hypothetical protein